MIKKSFISACLLYPLMGCAQHQLDISVNIHPDYELIFQIENNSNIDVVLEEMELPWEYGSLGTIELSAHGVAPKVARLIPLNADIAINNPLSNLITITPGQTIKGSIALDKLFPELSIESLLSEANVFWTYYLDVCELGKQYLNTGIIRFEDNRGRLLFILNEEFDITDVRTCE